MAAQARERVGDLWAEAREAAVADVDDSDFNRAATRAPKAAATVAATTAKFDPPSAEGPARKRATRSRKPRAPKPAKSSGDGAPEVG